MIVTYKGLILYFILYSEIFLRGINCHGRKWSYANIPLHNRAYILKFVGLIIVISTSIIPKIGSLKFPLYSII
jgi:hypothetical protein